MSNLNIKLGIAVSQYGYLPLNVNLYQTCHWLICGGSGSGKSTFLLYVMNQLLETDLNIYLGDFKGSQDFIGLTPNYAEFNDIERLIEQFYTKYQEVKINKTGEHLLLIIDEYAGFMVWLEEQDRKRASSIKNKLSEILMLGRKLPNNGSAWFWCICQRCDSTYFAHGSRDNYMLSVGFSHLSKESKTMLGIIADEIPDGYIPTTGKGLLSIDGKPLTVLQVPQIDVERLRQLLKKKAAYRFGEAKSICNPLT